MSLNFPVDIKAEALLNYFHKSRRCVELCGPHKRNAYSDLAAVSVDESGRIVLSVSRCGMYDILPECFFHPIDRFENIPANEYKERFREEYEQQQLEEADARKFFSGFDRFLLELNGVVAQIKDNYSDNRVVAQIIGDTLSERYLSNRFVRRTLQFLPHCKDIRGNKTLLTLMLRKVLFEEGLSLEAQSVNRLVTDVQPRYCSCLEEIASFGEDSFLGNEFEENVTVFDVEYWRDDECDASFSEFISEIDTYEQFVNDYFIGIESAVKFNISTDSFPVRLCDDTYNYLDYNANL